jgi:hypothetical protein
MPLELIGDGYELDAKTRPVGPWPAVAFVYRPALPVRVRAYLNAKAKAGDDEQAEMKAIAAILVDQMKSWDITASGKPTPITENTIRRVPEPVLRQLLDAVTGYGPGEQAADEKNSGTGSASS